MCVSCDGWNGGLLALLSEPCKTPCSIYSDPSPQLHTSISLSLPLLHSFGLCCYVCSGYDLQHWDSEWGERLPFLHSSRRFCLPKQNFIGKSKSSVTKMQRHQFSLSVACSSSFIDNTPCQCIWLQPLHPTLSVSWIRYSSNSCSWLHTPPNSHQRDQSLRH